MAVTNGQIANQTTFNNAFVSKQSLDQDVDGTINLRNADSGSDVVNVQQEINDIKTYNGNQDASISLINAQITASVSTSTGPDEGNVLVRTDAVGFIYGMTRFAGPVLATDTEANDRFDTKTGGEIYYNTTAGVYKIWSDTLSAWQSMPMGAASAFYVIPEDFGAIGDGSTDDTSAINSTLATGSIVVGAPGSVYAVTGDITLPATVDLRDIKFKQLSAASTTRKTLYQTGGTKCRMKNVTVDRNGDGLGGAIGTSAGIWIDTCNDVILEDIEITGDNKGDGLILINCDFARIIRPYVHDMNYGDASMAAPSDDVMQGVYIYGGSQWILDSPRVENLKGEWTSQSSTTRWTRGVAVGGASDFIINSPTVAFVDQGVDITGGDNPTRFSVNGGSVSDCYTYGFKSANSVQYGSFNGCTALRCGFAGFIASAPNDVITNRTGAISYIGCTAIATGSNGAYSTTVSGFRIMSTGTYPGEPLNIKFIGCFANGAGGAMNYGFYSDVTYTTTSSWNTVTDCESAGATTLQFSGFQSGEAQLYLTANQSIPNNTFTKIQFNDTSYDRMGSTDTSANSLTATTSGHVILHVEIGVASSAVGTRRIRILRGGLALDGAYLFVPPMNGGNTWIQMSHPILVDPGDEFTVEFLQDSGGALNVLATDTMFKMIYTRTSGRGRS